MRATWITSLTAGLLIGTTARLCELAKLDGSLPLIVFVIVVPVAVIGIPQLREARAERRKRGSFTLSGKGDLATFYLPTWGRMFGCFLSAVASTLILRAVGL